MNILKPKNGNQSHNKKCAYELVRSLHPGCTEIEAVPRKRKCKLMTEEGDIIFVSAYTSRKAAMIVKPEERVKSGQKASRKRKSFHKDVDIWAMVRQRDETLLIYFIRDIPELMGLRGKGAGISGSAVSWDNVSRVAYKTVTITNN